MPWPGVVIALFSVLGALPKFVPASLLRVFAPEGHGRMIGRAGRIGILRAGDRIAVVARQRRRRWPKKPTASPRRWRCSLLHRRMLVDAVSKSISLPFDRSAYSLNPRFAAVVTRL